MYFHFSFRSLVPAPRVPHRARVKRNADRQDSSHEARNGRKSGFAVSQGHDKRRVCVCENHAESRAEESDTDGMTLQTDNRKSGHIK